MPTICPDQNELSDLVLGRLDDDRLIVVAEHLDECDECRTAVDSIASGDDTFVESLRERALADEMADEPEFQLALNRIEAIGRALRSDEAPEMTDALGQVREYRLLAKLGEGGMGTVYKALHVKLRRIVALKLLALHRRHDPTVVSRFQREIEAVGKLNHPNIVSAHDAGEEDGMHYLVMELVDGADLHTLIKQRGPLPIADACEIVRQAALGLQHAHEHGLVHRDLKPSNILLSRDGQVKLLDLGLALLQGDGDVPDHLTGTGQVMGTLDYMAPEQADNSHAVDTRADIYALGCTLYKLLTGVAPFAHGDHDSPAKKIMAHANESPRRLNELCAAAPDQLVSLVERMLSKNPAMRPQTPSEVAAAIKPLASGSDLPGLMSQVDEPPQEPFRAASAAEIPVMIAGGSGSIPTNHRRETSGYHRPGGLAIWLGWLALAIALFGLVATVRCMVVAYNSGYFSPADLAIQVNKAQQFSAVGGLAFLAGVVLLIVGYVRRAMGPRPDAGDTRKWSGGMARGDDSAAPSRRSRPVISSAIRSVSSASPATTTFFKWKSRMTAK